MTYKHTYLAQKLNIVMGKVVLASAAGQEKAISIPHLNKSWPLSFPAYTYCTIIIYNSLGAYHYYFGFGIKFVVENH